MSTRDSVQAMAGNPFLSRKAGATDVYLVRHADALPGPETVIPGGTYDDQPLSETGQKQAAALGGYWAAMPFAALYASPLRRTQETAHPLATALGATVRLESDLREINLAGFMSAFADGATAAEHAATLRQRNAEIIRLVSAAGSWSAIPGAEESAAFRARVVAVVDGIAARHPGAQVALFTHGGVINIYIATVLGLDRDFFFPTPNTGVSVVRVQGERRILLGLNDIAHLRAANLVGEV